MNTDKKAESGNTSPCSSSVSASSLSAFHFPQKSVLICVHPWLKFS